MKRFSETRSSAVEWINALPQHWSEAPLKTIVHCDNSGHWGSDIGLAAVDLPVATTAQMDWNGGFDFEEMEIRSFSAHEYQTYRTKPGDIIVVKASGSATSIITGKAGFVTNGMPDFAFGNFLMRLACKPALANARYLYFLLSSNWTRQRIERMVATTTYPNLKLEEYLKANIPLPPLPEQRAIAAYLDRETAKIDTLISKQEQLIALLEEKRQALISHAVTKGLDPNVKMKNSGVEWLGKVPEHWEVKALKHLVSAPIIDGPHISPTKQDSGVPFISAEAISGGRINFEKMWGYISREDHHTYSKRYLPKRGDILMVKLGATTGVVAYVDTDEEFNVWVPLATIRISDKWPSKYHFYLLQSSHVRKAIELGWTYGTQQTLGLNTLANFRLPTPSAAECRSIIDELEMKIPIIDRLIKRAASSIELMREKRFALISAAVTGKIDVRDEAHL